jgi:hypothetical protein
LRVGCVRRHKHSQNQKRPPRQGGHLNAVGSKFCHVRAKSQRWIVAVGGLEHGLHCNLCGQVRVLQNAAN